MTWSLLTILDRCLPGTMQADDWGWNFPGMRRTCLVQFKLNSVWLKWPLQWNRKTVNLMRLKPASYEKRDFGEDWANQAAGLFWLRFFSNSSEVIFSWHSWGHWAAGAAASCSQMLWCRPVISCLNCWYFLRTVLLHNSWHLLTHLYDSFWI